MVSFIVTKHDKVISLKELENIQVTYKANLRIGFFDIKTAKDYSTEVKLWVTKNLDISFSNINQIIRDCQYVIDSDILQLRVLNNIKAFVNYTQSFLPIAQSDCEWPSCKDLLKYSDRDVIEKSKVLVINKNVKKIIRTVLNIRTMNDVITVGTLALYYLEILHSIKNELEYNNSDPCGNKHYIYNKALQELHYCECLMQKTGESIAKEKMNEYMEAQKESQEQKAKCLESNYCIAPTQKQMLPNRNNIII